MSADWKKWEELTDAEKEERDHLQKAYNALCSADDHLRKARESILRPSLAHIRTALAEKAFPDS